MAAPIVTVFRSRLSPEAHHEYGPLSQRMSELAEAMPGFVSAKTFVAPDGERVTIVVFQDQESHAAWREHPEHRQAQAIGIERLYAEYSIMVGDATYVHDFVRQGDT